MLIAAVFSELFNYHVARYEALSAEAENRNDATLLVAMRPAFPGLPAHSDGLRLGDRVQVILGGDDTDVNSHRATKQLRQILDSRRPDAILIPGYRHHYGRVLLRWCRRHGAGAILMSESRRDDFVRRRWLEWFKRQLVSLFDAALVGGKPHARYASQLGIDSDRIFTGYDVIDNEFWSRRSDEARLNAEQLRTEMDLPNTYFIAASRFIEKKNLSRLIEAYGRYVRQAPDSPWHLVLVGTGPLEAKLTASVAALGLGPMVRFTGYLPAEQLAVLFGLASGFIHASARAEQWGLVVNEAMAAGLPVLVSKTVGCVEDLIIPAQTGWLFDPFDVDAIASSMLALASLPKHKRQAVGQRARQHIAGYSPARFGAAAVDAAYVAARYAQQRSTILAWHPGLLL